MIKDDKFNASYYPQFDPKLQFMVVLFRFGAYGNGASRSNAASNFHISRGVISKFMRRIMSALLSLEKVVVRWPNASERNDIKIVIENEHGFRHVIGIVDGTHVILATKPSLNGEEYFNRKSRYSISCMIVNDYNYKILRMVAGFTGCVHDSRVFLNSKVWLENQKYFAANEYLLADSDYPLTAITMPPYKHHLAANRDNRRLNKHLSYVRLRAEHTIGHLKGRFQSLRGIPTVIRSKKDHTFVVLWIRCCVILHNLLLADAYDTNWVDGSIDPDRIVEVCPDSEKNPPQPGRPLLMNDSYAQKKREIMKASVLRFHDH
jgi:hypothetical protein